MEAIRFYKQAGIVLSFAAVSLWSAAANAESRLVPVFERTTAGNYIHKSLQRPAPSDVGGKQRIFPFDRPSRRNLLRRAASRGRLHGALGDGVDTVRVLLIRISFSTDSQPQLSSVADDGNFDLTSDGQSFIDPAPHDKDYFDSHMVGLRNYYRFQSCGKLDITWTILPEASDESYKLTDLADYGPGAGGDWTVESLVRFFRHSVEAADLALAGAGYPIHFYDFDAIIVAHAGANLQSDIDFDTPNDVPSFFARLGDEDIFTVDNGATEIVDGSVIPETATQDGLNGGIAAVLAHEFGHQLGLPDLYNIVTNYPTVGVWDNMDSGGLLGAYLVDEESGTEYYAEGFIPGGHGAWSRAFLGWTDTDTVRSLEAAFSLPAVEKCPARIVRVEASEDEYFLVENRAAELDDLPTYFIADDNGVIIGTGNSKEELVNGYDVLMPTEFGELSYDGGPGILIWHIDERLIAGRWEENTVNTYYPFGVSIVEASGVIDLGDPSSYFGMGWYDDAYYAGNNTELSDVTLPSSWSTWEVPTGVTVDEISMRDTLMSFGAGVRDVRHVQRIGTDDGISHTPSGILTFPGSYKALVIDSEGNGWITGTSDPVFTLQSPVAGPPALAPEFAGGGGAVVVSERRGAIHVFHEEDWSEYSGWPIVLNDLVTHPLAARMGSGTYIVAACELGQVLILDEGGGAVPGTPHTFVDKEITANIVASTDSLGAATGFFLLASGKVPNPHILLYRWDVIDDGSGGGEVEIDYAPEGYPQYITLSYEELNGGIAMVGGDIKPQLAGDEVYILMLSSGRILLYGGNGLLAERHEEEKVTAAPALYDLDADTHLDLIYTDGTYVYAITPTGANLRGWPRKVQELRYLPWNVVVTTPPTIIDSPGGGTVVFGTDNGLLYVLDHRGDLVSGYPRKASSSFESTIDIISIDDTGILAFFDDVGHEWLEVPLRSEQDYSFYRWRTAPYCPDQPFGSWCSVWGNYYRTAFAPRSGGSAAVAEEWYDLAGNLVIYPNPSRGDRIGIHFTAPAEGNAHLEILTITGELVIQRDKRLAGSQDEFVISMSDNASGVYICRLVITSGDRRAETLRKFAVVH